VAGNNYEVYDKKPQRYAEDNVAQRLIWNLSNNNKKNSARVILLRLTTEGHKASRGLSATAKLLVGLGVLETKGMKVELFLSMTHMMDRC